MKQKKKLRRKFKKSSSPRPPQDCISYRSYFLRKLLISASKTLKGLSWSLWGPKKRRRNAFLPLLQHKKNLDSECQSYTIHVVPQSNSDSWGPVGRCRKFPIIQVSYFPKLCSSQTAVYHKTLFFFNLTLPVIYWFSLELLCPSVASVIHAVKIWEKERMFGAVTSRGTKRGERVSNQVQYLRTVHAVELE